MYPSGPFRGLLLHPQVLWAPPLIAGLGFLIGFMFIIGPGMVLIVWGFSWVLACLLLFSQLRQVRRATNVGRSSPHGVPGRLLTIVSASLLGGGYIFFWIWVLTPSTICNALQCNVPATLPWTFGLLTLDQLLQIAFVLIFAGLGILTVASWRLARAIQRMCPPPGGGRFSSGPAPPV